MFLGSHLVHISNSKMWFSMCCSICWQINKANIMCKNNKTIISLFTRTLIFCLLFFYHFFFIFPTEKHDNTHEATFNYQKLISASTAQKNRCLKIYKISELPQDSPQLCCILCCHYKQKLAFSYHTCVLR